ncbi:phosphoenolpyruvate carboxykinase (ATP), partial [Francisella tularensis]|uniref:phosphoenolpyruvate carboxykinase (ATP) n=1 Tax=Francisella tularensis TaxID=263 RepID=UPI002381A8A6
VGWIEGDYNTGRRVPVEETKRIVNYLLTKPENVSFKFTRHKYFNFKALTSINDHGQELQLTNNWSDSAEYKKEYKSLAIAFIKNYEQF